MKISGKQYVILFGASIGSLFAGSSFMHAILKPDLTIPDLTGNGNKPIDSEGAATNNTQQAAATERSG
ncbi:hypothetical protein PINS_up023964 [Pythium insidiosum]|nr:hypothetical protein PINS_up009590 [Pythium insidiosum]GLE11508.1 hypothetical protein PINS_up023964 [Pythium insidiosum]